jgi:citrate lyase subunit beta/citryl-CoA lyase
MTGSETSVLRTYLYVPGDAGARLLTSTDRGADAVIADLEDGVAPTARADARLAVAAWLGRSTTGPTERWVRVGSGVEGLADVRASYSPELDGLVLAKIDHAALDDVARVLADIVPPGRARPRVMALVETATGLRDVEAIAAHTLVDLLQLGELDLAADLWLHPGDAGTELLYARSRVVLAAAAAGLEAPVGAVSPDFADLDALRSSTDLLRRLGFFGRAAIHPAQLSVIHDVFTPSPEQVQTAEEHVAAYDRALAAGVGVITDREGHMIDEAVIRASRRTRALARQLDSREANR